MNDLFSSASFKKYTDIKLDDVELGNAAAATGDESGINLDSFFQEVENVKGDLKELEKLHKCLSDTNEETKNAHTANAVKSLRSRMDQDVEKVLRRAKAVKAKLEALERSNAASRKIPESGPGTSTDRTRTSVVSGLGKKLKDLMDDFQSLRNKISTEYKETVGRWYFTVTGQQADENTIETLISTGESESFMQRAIEEQGRGQVMDTITEIQERHDAVKEIEKNLMDLHQVFMDMAALVEAQGHQLNDIESHVAHASSFVRKGTEQLEVAKEIQKDSRKWACLAIVLGTVVVIILILPIVLRFH
ncbi:hypothetical protein ZOSMA_98G00390 [Zostera marina]|uniref:t-SNARE coiled-coil homology domain-containing protein n=1 Tax=Zostera marina TaxID=29655 RepID=A0A0K9NHJ4_ZOSMR|nr:hypothetical protein ZOSMA_98G00390 [Zostera marina]